MISNLLWKGFEKKSEIGFIWGSALFGIFSKKYQEFLKVA